MPDFISPQPVTLADEVLSRATPPDVVMAMVQNGLLSIDDFWTVGRPPSQQRQSDRSYPNAPRGLGWAWLTQTPDPWGARPTSNEWESMRQGQNGSTEREVSNRLLSCWSLTPPILRPVPSGLQDLIE